jgi:hypothetical protein
MTTAQSADQNHCYHTVEFNLEGFKCLRFFDPESGQLYLLGPKASTKAQHRYLDKYAALCSGESLREALASIKSEPDMSMKLNAVLHAIEEHEAETAKCNVFEILIKVLDTWARQQPLGFVAWCLANARNRG